MDQINIWLDKQTDRWTDRLIDSRVDRQHDRLTDRDNGYIVYLVTTLSLSEQLFSGRSKPRQTINATNPTVRIHHMYNVFHLVSALRLCLSLI